MRKRLLFASLLVLMGCGNRDFNRPELLNEPRILAVQADPPQPSLGVATTLRALYYQPPPSHYQQVGYPAECSDAGTTPTYHWEWCPFPLKASADGTDYICPVSQTQLAPMLAALGIANAPAMDLGNQETASFTNPFPAAVLYALCRGDIGSSLTIDSSGNTTEQLGAADGGTQSSVFSCDLPAGETNSKAPGQTHPIGFPLTIKLTVTPPCPSSLPSGFSPLITTYTLHLPTNDAIPVNQNPTVNGLCVVDHFTGVDGGALDGGATSTTDDAAPPCSLPNARRLDEAGSVTVQRNQHVELGLDIDISAAEHLAVPSSVDYDSQNKLTRHFEHLTFTWFTETGNFGNAGKGGRNTGYLPSLLPEGQDETQPTADEITSFIYNITNYWSPPKSADYTPDTARLIVVVRDNRGGITWTAGVASLEPQP